MGAIAKEFFSSSPVLFYPLLALALFMVVFLVVSARAWFGKDTDAAARLPLEDGESR